MKEKYGDKMSFEKIRERVLTFNWDVAMKLTSPKGTSLTIHS